MQMGPFEVTRDSDEDCMLRYAAGELAAFQVLYERHRGGLYRYFLRQSPRDVAEELFQDVWARVIKARRSYRPDATFRTWLYTLARNRLIDFWRRQGRDPLAMSDNAAEMQEDAAGSMAGNPRRLADLRDCLEQLLGLVEVLPVLQRETFLLRHDAGMTLAEIAAALDTGVETARSRLRYAMERLRAGLPEECLEGHEHG
jgi:RNA polymerase sigma-70 factor (ECF subfamily)